MKRSYIIVTFGAIISLLLFVWFLNSRQFGTLMLLAPEQTPNGSDVTIEVVGSSSTKEITLKPGQAKTVRMKAATVQVNSRAGDVKTVDIVTIEQGKTNQLTVPSGEQHAVQQLGTNARFCPVLVGEKIYSYNCQGAGPIVQHGKISNTVIFEGKDFVGVQSTTNGLIGFFANDLTKLLYIDLTNETTQAIALPPVTNPGPLPETPIVITSNEPGSTSFMLMYPNNNSLFVYDNPADTVPLALPIGEGAKLNDVGRASSASFVGENVMLYVGNALDVSDGDDTEDETITPNLPSYIFEYDKTGTLKSTLKLQDGFSAQSVNKVGEGYYVAELLGSSQFYFDRSGNLEPIYSLNDVGNILTFQNKTYLQAVGTIYQFSPSNNGQFGLHSMFSSADLRASGIFSSQKGLIFTAFLGTTSAAPLNIYQMLDELAAPGVLPPGVVPYEEPTFVGVEDLLEIGLTSEQVTGVKQAAGAFIQSTGKSVSQASFENIQAVPRNRFSPDPVFELSFVLLLDAEPYNATLKYSTLITIQLLLHDPNTGAQIYDSESVTN